MNLITELQLFHSLLWYLSAVVWKNNLFPHFNGSLYDKCVADGEENGEKDKRHFEIILE